MYLVDLIKTIFGRPGEYIYVALVTLMLLGPITAYFKLAGKEHFP